MNWALRQIGKRNLALNTAAVATAREIAALHSATARWVASDALRELTNTQSPGSPGPVRDDNAVRIMNIG